MGSKLFRILYNSSILIPWLLINFGISIYNLKYLELYITFFLLIIITGIQFIVYKFIKNFQKFWIEIDNCDGISNNYTLFFLSSYFSPIIDVAKLINFSFLTFIKYIFFVLLILFIFLKDNYNFENIFLKVLGYKVYKVEAKGIEYILLSKKNIRNTQKVKNVIRVFEYMLIEEEKIE